MLARETLDKITCYKRKKRPHQVLDIIRPGVRKSGIGDLLVCNITQYELLFATVAQSIRTLASGSPSFYVHVHTIISIISCRISRRLPLNIFRTRARVVSDILFERYACLYVRESAWNEHVVYHNYGAISRVIIACVCTRISRVYYVQVCAYVCAWIRMYM